MTHDEIIAMAIECASTRNDEGELVLTFGTEVIAFASAITTKAAADLANIQAAAKKCQAAKGRYHSQLAYCELFDLLGLPSVRPVKPTVEG